MYKLDCFWSILKYVYIKPCENG
ncbi:hypothetical protein F383_33640 [Gossypium arboreum]|uniref:Uncharacterized protein n=1 Tax=Gossypium arboreum TaxID=29729 RepID=A0A0B0N1W7_GOSAR|nr:hypothetical protein F383_33640 [Gossypium arboreum]